MAPSPAPAPSIMSTLVAGDGAPSRAPFASTHVTPGSTTPTPASACDGRSRSYTVPSARTRLRVPPPLPIVPVPKPARPPLNFEPRGVRELLDSFFSHVHVENPIFDKTSTRSLVQSVVLNGIDWTAESCLAPLILAPGAVATPLGPSHSTMSGSAAYTEAQSYFHAAQKRLGVVTTSDHTIAPQCLFPAGVYLMCSFQPREAWRCFLQALAGCQHFAFLSPGSQREYHNALAEDRHYHTTAERLQQAIYWSAWKSERAGRSLFPRLQDFSTEDHNSGTATTLYPSFFPTPPGPRVDTHMHSVHSGTSRVGVMTISLRHLCARIGAELLELREKHASSQPGFLAAVAANIPSYEEQTLDWIRSLPPCLSFDAAPEKDDICRFALRGQALNIYEMIYWPFLSTILGGDGVSTHGYFNGRDQAGLHRQLAQKGLDYHLYRLVVNKPGYQHRHHGTLYMMHSCYRSSLILVAAAIGCAPGGEDGGDGSRFSLSVPPGRHQSVGEVLSLLAIWSTETSEFDQVRSVLEAGPGYTLATLNFLQTRTMAAPTNPQLTMLRVSGTKIVNPQGESVLLERCVKRDELNQMLREDV
ncbi:C6 zinc finger domain-containing protein [Gaeumannomyces tritici R3-111a-1]|uniref:C6 zinc finger domain-containing protein n=1 Tax=Gaeumannomyces tritici (strain R3-111a-1) TaxID=644352 RepID=J3NMQ4_GAET3|nr:C6 zinc finger domain-containing protein [Gaeumannomyces tritici R3-111a-1]EJT82587.1 C6 zinc finger domain-containing protein [Gaeumannomyces tritici R3-111a-1]